MNRWLPTWPGSHTRWGAGARQRTVTLGGCQAAEVPDSDYGVAFVIVATVSSIGFNFHWHRRRDRVTVTQSTQISTALSKL